MSKVNGTAKKEAAKPPKRPSEYQTLNLRKAPYTLVGQYTDNTTENVRSYKVDWTRVQGCCAQLCQVILTTCGTTNALFDTGLSEINRQAYVNAHAFMVDELRNNAIHGDRPSVTEMPYAFAILFFSMSDTVRVRQAGGGTVLCNMIDNAFTPIEPSIPLGPLGGIENNGFRTIGPYAPSPDASVRRAAFVQITQRAKDTLTIWREGNPKPKEVMTGTQFTWSVPLPETGYLKGYNALLQSEFPMHNIDPNAPPKDFGLAHCALVQYDASYSPNYTERTYMHPVAAFGWHALAGQEREMNSFPRPVIFDAAEMMAFVVGHFQGIDIQSGISGPPVVPFLHQTTCAGGADYFATLVLRMIAVAFGKYQAMVFPSEIVGATTLSGIRTLAQGTQNILSDVSEQAFARMFQTPIEILRSLFASAVHSENGPQHNIPIVVVPPDLQEVVAGSTQWTRLTGTDAVDLTAMKDVSSNVKYSLYEPYEGPFADFIMSLSANDAKYQNYVGFSSMTNQKEIARSMARIVRFKPLVDPETITTAGGYQERKTMKALVRDARNRHRRVHGLEELPEFEEKRNPNSSVHDGGQLNQYWATGKIGGAVHDEERALLALPLFFVLVDYTPLTEQAVVQKCIAWQVPNKTMNMTPRASLYEKLFISGAKMVTDVANNKSINEIQAVMDYYNREGLGGALTLMADKIARRPAIVKNPWAGKLITGAAKVAEAGIGKTKVGKKVQAGTKVLAQTRVGQKVKGRLQS